MKRILAPLALALYGALYASLAPAYVLVPKDPTYLKECGSCHTAFSPQLLPAASWRRIMGHLDQHFGDSAQLDAAGRDAITRYLVDNAADHANSDEAHVIMRSLGPGEVPARITDVPFIAGLHAAVMDPRWQGQPRPKRLTECEVCHVRAPKGDYRIQAFSVSDELFSESKGMR
ncbi:MAG TPA: hypothetical protein VFE23_19935 [Usitatibacter sp.]|jgi:hypothetical protein|nr:hypothetical protein [Usitatibacter sp.]